MAVEFDYMYKDISCNTVRYNYKQTRNLIADNCFKQGYWNTGTAVVESGYAGLPSYMWVRYPANSGLVMLQQAAFRPTANHVYYGGQLWMTRPGFSAGDARFEWYHIDGDTNVNMTFAQRVFYPTEGNIVKVSAIIQAGSNPNQEAWVIRDFVYNNTVDAYSTKAIIVDLTECFGAGNEPTKEWCDENILEWSKFTAFNDMTLNETNVKNSITGSTGQFTYFGVYPISEGNNYFENRLDVPRSYNVDCNANDTGPESNIYLPSANLDRTKVYYAFADLSQPSGNMGKSYDWYFPLADPKMGDVPQVDNPLFNGGGGLNNWKRVSFCVIRSSFTNGTYPSRFGVDNNYQSLWLSITNFGLMSTDKIASMYNSIYGYSPNEMTHMTKTFCDRWISGDSDCIIRIKDHLNKTIKFNTAYDIVCNDIEIRPDLNTIKFKSDGTIVCGRLFKAQQY